MRITGLTEARLDHVIGLMTASPLLRRYGVTRRSARASLMRGRRTGDVQLVASDGGKVIGFAWMILTQAFDRTAYLRLLLVAEGRQSRGVGAALLGRVEQLARAAASRHLMLLVTANNRRARAFYARQGYRHVGDLPSFVRRRMSESLYVKIWNRHS
jgi:GNAT superfamily N-acetyltransferase